MTLTQSCVLLYSSMYSRVKAHYSSQHSLIELIMVSALEPAISQPLSCVAKASFNVNVYTEASSITDAGIQKNMQNASCYASELEIVDWILCAERVHALAAYRATLLLLALELMQHPERSIMFNARRKDLRSLV